MSSGNCIFCKIANKEIPAKIVFDNDGIIAFEDIKPQAPVHIIVIPKLHLEKISDITEKEALLIGRLFLAANKIAREKKIDGSGYRLIINCNKDAGQEVFHIHLHLLGGRKFAWPPG